MLPVPKLEYSKTTSEKETEMKQIAKTWRWEEKCKRQEKKIGQLTSENVERKEIIEDLLYIKSI